MEQQEKGLDLSLLNEELRRAVAAGLSCGDGCAARLRGSPPAGGRGSALREAIAKRRS